MALRRACGARWPHYGSHRAAKCWCPRTGALGRPGSVGRAPPPKLSRSRAPMRLAGARPRGISRLPKSEVAASPPPSRGPKRGRECYVTPAFSGVPNTKRGEQNQKWLPHPCLLGGPKEGGNATSPLHSRGPQSQVRGTKSEVDTSPLPSRGLKRGGKCYVTPAFSGIPNKGEQNQKWLLHPCLLGGPKEGGNATSPLHSRGHPTKGSKIRSGCLSPAFSGAQKRAGNATSPLHSQVPQSQARGTKSEVDASPLPSQGLKRGGKCYVTPAFSGIPNKGEQNQKWLLHPCLLGGPKEGGNATSPLHSRGHPTQRSKIKSGCLTPAFLGAQKRAEMLCHPCILGGP